MTIRKKVNYSCLRGGGGGGGGEEEGSSTKIWSVSKLILLTTFLLVGMALVFIWFSSFAQEMTSSLLLSSPSSLSSVSSSSSIASSSSSSISSVSSSVSSPSLSSLKLNPKDPTETNDVQIWETINMGVNMEPLERKKNKRGSIILKNTSLLKRQPKKIKMIFVAGLEGTGHHLFHAVFTNLSRVDKSIHMEYYIQHPMVPCARKCFMFELHGRGQNYCNCMGDHLREISLKLEHDSLLYFRSFSFPFSPSRNSYPDLVKLISIAQNSTWMNYIFDIKVVVLKRSWAEAVTSACRRFGRCEQRLSWISFMLNELQDQLLHLDKAFWIVLDYQDLCHRPASYTDILVKFLELKNRDQVQRILEQTIVVNSHSLPTNNLKVFSQRAQDYKYPVTVLDNTSFLVTPEHTEFLDSKFQ